jgi:ketosteroid isomerase-like protein
VKMTQIAACMLAAMLAGSSVVAEEENHADHEALRGMRRAFEEAAAKNNMDLMKPYLATNFSIVTFTDREFSAFESFKAQWGKTRNAMLGERGSYRVDLDPEYSVLMGDVALCRGNAKNELVDGKGHRFEFTSHWSVVCRKIDGEWKIVRGHNSLNPFDNPMLKQGVKSLLVKAVAAGLVAGLVLGAVGARLLRRRT